MISWLRVLTNDIPPELRALPWVLWRGEDRGGPKPTKVPYRVAAPARKASTTDPATWAPFDVAVRAYAALADRPVNAVDGIGVVLTAGAGITCIDLDRVIAPDGALDTRAATIVERCDSWAEISPSGTGLHVFVLGTVPRGLRGGQIEVYCDARFICVTGKQWPGTPNALRWQQPYLDHLVRIEANDRAAPRTAHVVRSMPPPDDLAGALLAKLERWGIPAARMKRWSDGYLVELAECPWADDHTSGRGGAAVMIHASGAWDFTCLHAHCARRRWRDFRDAMGRDR